MAQNLIHSAATAGLIEATHKKERQKEACVALHVIGQLISHTLHSLSFTEVTLAFEARVGASFFSQTLPCLLPCKRSLLLLFLS